MRHNNHIVSSRIGKYQKSKNSVTSVTEKLELVTGLEPATCWLRISCSTDWATLAKMRIMKVFQNFLPKIVSSAFSELKDMLIWRALCCVGICIAHYESAALPTELYQPIPEFSDARPTPVAPYIPDEYRTELVYHSFLPASTLILSPLPENSVPSESYYILYSIFRPKNRAFGFLSSPFLILEVSPNFTKIFPHFNNGFSADYPLIFHIFHLTPILPIYFH